MIERNQKLVDTKEAAELLGYSSAQSIWTLRLKGLLKPIETPEPKMYFLESEVLALRQKIGDKKRGPKQKKEIESIEERKAS